MNVLQQTVFLSLLEKTAQGYKSKQRPSPTEPSCNQLDVALTSMYTKVLIELGETNAPLEVGKGT